MAAGSFYHDACCDHGSLVHVGVMSSLGFVTALMCPSCRRAWVRDLSGQPRPQRYVGTVRDDGSQVLDIEGTEEMPGGRGDD